MVSRRQMGQKDDPPVRSDCHDHIPVRNLILHLYRHSRHAGPDGALCHDIQRSFWRFVGPYTMAVPSGNLAAEHQGKGSKS